MQFTLPGLPDVLAYPERRRSRSQDTRELSSRYCCTQICGAISPVLREDPTDPATIESGLSRRLPSKEQTGGTHIVAGTQRVHKSTISFSPSHGQLLLQYTRREPSTAG